MRPNGVIFCIVRPIITVSATEAIFGQCKLNCRANQELPIFACMFTDCHATPNVALSIRVVLICAKRSKLASFLRAGTSAAGQNPRSRLRVRSALAHDLRQVSIQWVLRVCPVEALITVAATDDQICTFELGEFILHGSQREEAQARQLARIQLLAWIREEQSQHVCTHEREQSMEQRLFDGASFISNVLSIQAESQPSQNEHRCD